MLERLTPDATKVVLFAQEEARRLGHNYVDSEILLLGLIAVSIPPAARLSDAVVPSLKAASKAVESIIGRGSDFVSRDPPFTPVAQRVIKSASQEARGGHVSSEHIFRALLCEGDSDAVHILDALSVDRALVADALKCLNDNAQAATEASQESDQWEEDDRPCTQEEALSRVFGLNSFIKAKSVPAGMLSWFDEKDEILGCYINAEDDLLSGRLSAHLKRACDNIATSSLNGSTKVSDVGCMTPPIWRCLCQEHKAGTTSRVHTRLNSVGKIATCTSLQSQAKDMEIRQLTGSYPLWCSV